MKKHWVVKLGGSSLQNTQTLQELVQFLQGAGPDVALTVVHGGGPAINQELTARNISWQFIRGQRQTTPEMMGVIEDVLAGQVNGQVVRSLQQAGLAAGGFSGATHGILLCKATDPELLQVGEVQEVDLAALWTFWERHPEGIPVVAPIGRGLQGSEKFNINADWAAVKIAAALQAEKLFFLTDQEGLLDGQKRLVSQVDPGIIDKMIQDGVISGGMYTKVLTMMAALQAGVAEVRVIHAHRAAAFHKNENQGTALVALVASPQKEEGAWTQKTT